MSSRLRAAALGLCGVVAVAVLLGSGAEVRGQSTKASPCSVYQTKTASPQLLLVGETLDITLAASIVCADEATTLHIVLALDGSAFVDGATGRDMNRALRQFVQDLRLPDNPGVKVGVVFFNDDGRTICKLTSETTRILGCLNRGPGSGQTRIDRGLEEASRSVQRGRFGLGPYDGTMEVIILVSAGPNATGCVPVQRAASSIRRQGMLLIAVCAGPDCDRSCIRDVATSPRYYFELPDFAGLSNVFSRIRTDILRITVRTLTIVDQLPNGIDYVESAAGQPTPAWDASLRRLTWEAQHVPVDGITYTFSVRPQRAGPQATNAEAVGRFVDTKYRMGVFTFSVPFVNVLEARLAPTPLVSPVPTATSTPSERRHFLPWLSQPSAR